MRMRAIADAIAAMAVLFTAAGCGSDGITRQRVEAAVGPTFANLYVTQQAAQRDRKLTTSELKSHAKCEKGGPNDPDKGAGEDWICTITWTANSSGVPAAASYAMHVKPDGCYTADGDGPPDVNGSRTIVTSDGDSVTNPLWAFDGCFNVS